MKERVAILLFYVCFAPNLLPGGLAVFTLDNPDTGFTFVVFENEMDETNSWYDARAMCRSYLPGYADLAEMTSSSDVITVKNLLANSQASSSSFWFGIYDHASETNFKSLSNGLDLTFETWDSGRPKNDANKNCGALHVSSGLWRDEACTGKMRGVLCRMLSQTPPSSIDPNTGCPLTMVPFAGLCYDFQLLMIGNFSEARMDCEARPSGRMVVPNSQTEADFVELYSKLTGDTYFWLGITDEQLDDELRSIYEPALPYENWQSSGPDVVMSVPDCAFIDAESGTWFVDNCGEPKGIMCTVVPPSQALPTTAQPSTQDPQMSTIGTTTATIGTTLQSTIASDADVTSSISTSQEGALGPCKNIKLSVNNFVCRAVCLSVCQNQQHCALAVSESALNIAVFYARKRLGFASSNHFQTAGFRYRHGAVHTGGRKAIVDGRARWKEYNNLTTESTLAKIILTGL